MGVTCGMLDRDKKILVESMIRCHKGPRTKYRWEDDTKLGIQFLGVYRLDSSCLE